MNLRDISYLLALAKFKNFSQAAAHCHISQPTLSMQIRKLEDTLGCQLFERQRQQLLITADGQTAIDYAQQIHTIAQDMRQHFKQRHLQHAVKLRLGLFPTLAPYLLPKLAPLLKKNLPNLTLLLHEMISEECITGLCDGQLDVILIASELHNPNLSSIKLWREKFYLVTSRQHYLKKYKILKPEQLPLDELILLEQGHCLRDQGLAYCQSMQQNPAINYQATSLETLLSMVEMGEGVTFIPQIALPYIKKRNLQTYNITKPPVRTVYMYWRKSLQQAALLKSLCQLLQSL